MSGENADSATGFDRQPDRYTSEGGREACDIIREQLGDGGFVAWCEGNALKYELRAGKKSGADVDLEKARWYRMMAAHVRGYGPDPRAGRTK